MQIVGDRVSKVRLSLLLAAITASTIATSFLVMLLDDPRELTKVRNAFLVEIGRTEQFRWSPPENPSFFSTEHSAPPRELNAAVMPLRTNNHLETSINLVDHLRTKPKRPGPIQSNTIEAHNKIVNTGRGYCADYTQVFNGLAAIADIPVREWGVSFDGFGGDGHAFNEIWDPRLSKWIMIDPMNAFYAQDALTSTPLSVLEFREMLASNPSQIVIRPIGEKMLFKSGDEAVKYYLQGVDQFYLWTRVDVFTFDSHPLVSLAGNISRVLEQIVAIVVGVHPKILAYPTTHTEELLRELRSFQAAVVLCFAVLGTSFLVLILIMFANHPRSTSASNR